MIKSLEMLHCLFLVLLKLHLIYYFAQSISSYMNLIVGFLLNMTFWTLPSHDIPNLLVFHSLE